METKACPPSPPKESPSSIGRGVLDRRLASPPPPPPSACASSEELWLPKGAAPLVAFGGPQAELRLRPGEAPGAGLGGFGCARVCEGFGAVKPRFRRGFGGFGGLREGFGDWSRRKRFGRCGWLDWAGCKMGCTGGKMGLMLRETYFSIFAFFKGSPMVGWASFLKVQEAIVFGVFWYPKSPNRFFSAFGICMTLFAWLV